MASKAEKLDAKSTDPPLLQKYSTIKSYKTSIATYDKLRIFYRKHPQTDNLPKDPPLPLLVFIHGLGGSVAQFNRILQSLTQNASCLAVDLPGCGVSEYTQTKWEAYTTDALVELLEVIINDYRGKGQKVVLIAHSMGCGLATLLANPRSVVKSDLHENVLGLVAMCPPKIPTERQVTLYRRQLWVPEFIFNLWRAWDRRGGINSASVSRFVGPKADVEARKLQLMFNYQSRSPVFRRMAWGFLPEYKNGEPRGGFPENRIWTGLQVPVLLISGGRDEVTPAAEAERIYHLVLQSHTTPPKGRAILDMGSPVSDFSLEAPSSLIPPLPSRPPKYVELNNITEAGHGLLFTEAVVPGLISDFLSQFITRRLELGWQLQYLTRDGKWDVKNLEKWQKVVPVSDPIGNMFRAIKTLRQVDEVHSPSKFTQEWGDILKDVIDISHDTPVYDPQKLRDMGVRYHKVPTVSKIPPPREDIVKFIETVDKIREERRELQAASEHELEIAVHCHYGFNRTGFLIVCYLVERLGYTVDNAIRHFAEARPNGIKHAHFRDRLHVMYAERNSPTSKPASGERTPLLADGVPSRNSIDSLRRAEQEDAAIHGTPLSTTTTRTRTRTLRELLLFAWALLATAGVIVLAVVLQHRNSTTTPPPAPTDPVPIIPGDPGTGTPYPSLSSTTPQAKKDRKRNLIFMVSDGMGPASLSLTRSFRQHVSNLPMDDTLVLDQHFWGTSRTRSSNSWVTDSAAGATAFSCARKSYNGAIGMEPGFKPCGTMDEIALQEIGEGVLGRSVDLILGGGRCHFLRNSTVGSCRQDDVDVVGIGREKHGWGYVDDRAGFDSLNMGKNVSLPLLGLFAARDVPFEIDRRHMEDVYPSLSEMAVTALKALEEATKDSEKGFFLMIEGSRIDHAGHINDPAAQVREVLEYDKTFNAVLDFIKESDTEGVLVATSDHETGGLSTAWQAPNELPVYNWHPEVLLQANASAEYLTILLQQHIIANPAEGQERLQDWIRQDLVEKRLGIRDALEIEINALASNPLLAMNIFSKMVSIRARIGWSTHGHSAVDVNIYSSGGPGTEEIRGNVENTDVGGFLRRYLDVDVDEITKELRERMVPFDENKAIRLWVAREVRDAKSRRGGRSCQWFIY
ncbi:alkaline phosphatase [Cercophora samala]|uniref:Alkaline phosphatase n=1 Tax=Cercophora samala TaxID=330535 RepID=A0AA40DH26_9PEZI|nr:alkaline phosphatase [Cercophora samala]